MTVPTPTDRDFDRELHAEVARYYDDPLAFTLAMYPWPIKGEAGPDQWQAEVLEDIGRQVHARGFDGRQSVMPVRVAISSGHGTGKAQPVSLWLDTPSGRRQWGDLSVGDEVFGADGQPTTIVGVYDRGVLPVYRVRFDDRTETRVCGEHVWLVRGRQQRRRQSGAWVLRTTDEVRRAGVQRPNGKARARQWEVPITKPVEYLPRSLPVAPYLLGVWLGDGGRESAVITTMDSEIIDHIRACGDDAWPVHGLGWRVPGLQARLRGLGILSAYSYQKAVPTAYREAPSAVRAEVLRGLLDTDGECDRQGSVIFSSTSRGLVDDVVWLARSLGGKAMVQPSIKHPHYPGARGERLAGRPSWRATLAMPTDFRCFYIRRKADRVPRHLEPRYRAKWMDTIERDGSEECRCITVAAPDGLYLTNDFIVTHNTVLAAWIAIWLMATRQGCRGTVTSNTNEQLQGKLWAGIREWLGLSLVRNWFEANSAIWYRKGHRATWFTTPQTCAEENSEAFAGQHAKDSSSLYLFDEASSIPEVVWQVAEGGLTDGEPFIIVTGNPTRNTGAFHEACFGRGRDKWQARIIDARDCRLPNKALIAEWIAEYGEDSDFVRVRVRGLPPRASELQFIGQDLVWGAQQRALPVVLPDEPLIAGVDVSDGGAAWNVVRFRRGSDARTLPPIRVPGQATRDDRSAFLSILAGVLSERDPLKRVDMMFVDSAFGAPYVERLQAMGFKQVAEVRGGATHPPDHTCANMRAYMWSRVKDWLRHGAVPADDVRLATDLTGPGHHLTKQDRLLIESKESMQKRGVASPDDGDALAYTFAAPVTKTWRRAEQRRRRQMFEGRRGSGDGRPTWMG